MHQYEYIDTASARNKVAKYILIFDSQRKGSHIPLEQNKKKLN